MKFIHSILIVVWIVTIPSRLLVGQEQPFSFTVIPSKPLMPKLTANATEHGLSISKILTINQFWTGIGGGLPVLGFKYGRCSGDLVIASTVYTQLDRKGGSIRVINTDFYVDINLSLTWNEHTIIQFGPGHTSQHLNDDAIEIFGYSHSINYVRDYVKFVVLQKSEFLHGFFYTAIYYHHTFKIPIPGNHIWLFEFGADVLNYNLNEFISAYMAMDIKLRDEFQFGTTQSYQAGIKIKGGSLHIIRIAYNFRTGYEERGQFFNQKVNLHTLGAYFDF